MEPSGENKEEEEEEDDAGEDDRETDGEGGAWPFLIRVRLGRMVWMSLDLEDFLEPVLRGVE